MTDLTPARLAEMLAKATPGPWDADRDMPYKRMPRVYSVGGDGRLIAEVGNAVIDQDTWEANAALIALSPSLAARVIELEGEVERLQEALTYIADHNNAFLKDGDRATRTCLDALVAKARTALETPNAE